MEARSKAVEELKQLLEQGEGDVTAIADWAMGESKSKVQLLAVELVARTRAYRLLEQRVEELEREIKRLKGGK